MMATNDDTVPALVGDACACGRAVPEDFREANRGKKFKCTACGTRFRIPALIPAPPPPPVSVTTTSIEPIVTSAPIEPSVTPTPEAPVNKPIAPAPKTPSVFVEARNPIQLLNDKCVVIETSYHAPGAERKIRAGEGRFEATGGNSPDQKRIRALKKLWNCPEYNAIKTHDGQTQRRIDKLALPQSVLAGEGRRVVLLVDIEKIVNTLDNEDEPTRRTLIEAFVNVYPALIEQARKPENEGGLGALFNAADFPAPGAEIRSCFMAAGKALTRRIRMATESTPASLASVSEDFLRRELQSALDEGSETVNQLRDGLRLAMSELVTGIADRLKSAPGEAAKGLREGNLTKLQEFVDGVLAAGDRSRNITGDETLKKLAEQARGLLAGVEVKDIRKNVNVKNAFEGAVVALKAELDAVVVTKPRRKFGAE